MELLACDDVELLRSPFEAALPPPSHVQPGRLVVQKPDLPRPTQADRATAASGASPYTTRAADRCCRSAVCVRECGRAVAALPQFITCHTCEALTRVTWCS